MYLYHLKQEDIKNLNFLKPEMVVLHPQHYIRYTNKVSHGNQLDELWENLSTFHSQICLLEYNSKLWPWEQIFLTGKSESNSNDNVLEYNSHTTVLEWNSLNSWSEWNSQEPWSDLSIIYNLASGKGGICKKLCKASFDHEILYLPPRCIRTINFTLFFFF